MGPSSSTAIRGVTGPRPFIPDVKAVTNEHHALAHARRSIGGNCYRSVMTNTDRSSSGVSVDIFILPQSFRFHETRMYGNNLLFQLLSRIISGCIPERLEEQKIYPKLDKKRCR